MSWVKLSQDVRAILDGFFALARNIQRLGLPAYLPVVIGTEYVVAEGYGAALRIRYYLIRTDRNCAVLVGLRVEEFRGLRWMSIIHLLAFDAPNGEILFKYPNDWPPRTISVAQLLKLDAVPAVSAM